MSDHFGRNKQTKGERNVGKRETKHLDKEKWQNIKETFIDPSQGSIP